jgi:hypothetical protein
MAFRFEFDRSNGILLAHFEGQLTNESATEYYEAIRKCASATDAKAGIWDLSSVTDFALASDFVRSLAGREPAMPASDKRPRFIVATATAGFGLMRMFQIVGGSTTHLINA